VAKVGGQKDDGHAALAQLPFDRVSALKALFETIQKGYHGPERYRDHGSTTYSWGMSGRAESFADRYTLDREIGRGGMATVWLARDLRHERRVALKILHPEALLAQVDSMSRSFVPMPLHTAVYVAQAWADLGDAGRAVQWLEKYERSRDLHFQLHLRCDPSFARIAGAVGYRALLLPIRGC